MEEAKKGTIVLSVIIDCTNEKKIIGVFSSDNEEILIKVISAINKGSGFGEYALDRWDENSGKKTALPTDIYKEVKITELIMNNGNPKNNS